MMRASKVNILDQEQGKEESQTDRDILHQSQGRSMLLDSPKRETVPLPLILPTAAPEESQWGARLLTGTVERSLWNSSRETVWHLVIKIQDSRTTILRM